MTKKATDAKATPAEPSKTFVNVKVLKNVSLNKNDLDLKQPVTCEKTVYKMLNNKNVPHKAQAKPEEMVRHDSGAITVRYHNNGTGEVEDKAILAPDDYGTVKVMSGCTVYMAKKLAQHFQKHQAIQALV